MRFTPVIPSLLLAAVSFAPRAVGQEGAASVRAGPRVIDARELLVGRLIADLPFVDLDGKAGTLSDYRQNPLLVICMSATDCPIAKKYVPRLVELEQRYREKRVAFLMVNSQAHQTTEGMQSAVQKSGIVARYVLDPAAKIATALKASSTTEVFLLDSSRTLLYRGAVDDQYGLGYTLPEVRQHLLIQAIDAALAGKLPPVAATTAPGCELAVGDAEATGPSTELTWHNRISRIVQNNCQICHRPGAAGPFELLTYEDAKDHAKTIKREVGRLAMPPWFADGPRGHWANDARLTEEDRSDLLAWLAAGAPEGDPTDAALPRQWVEGWQIGKPDAVFEAEQPVAVAAQGAMPYQEVLIKPNLAEDKWVGAVEIRNEHPEVVHHVLAFLMYPSDHPLAERQMINLTGNKGCFAWMAPGWTATTYPPGMAKLLPHGVELLLQIHYTPNGSAVMDRPSVAFTYVGKPDHELKTRAADNRTFEIPAGAANYPVSGTYEFANPARIVSFFPHTHVRGVGFEYELHFPDGISTKVLDLPRYDFNWQLTYTLIEPIDVPAGTVLKATGWYDNSSANPANPDPTKPVRFGLQSWDEMMLAYFTSYALPTINPVPDRDELASLTMKRRLRNWVKQNPAVSVMGVLGLAVGLGLLIYWRRARQRAAAHVPAGSPE